MISEVLSTYYHNKEYIKILEQYSDVIDLKTGMLYTQNGKRSVGINGRFEHIPCDLVNRVNDMFKLNPEGKFLDIGSGLGNILNYAKSVGFKKVTGIEINTDLKKYNIGNDVIWDDVFDCADIIKEYDLIWLYRPFFECSDMDRLLEFIKVNSKKEGVVILYESPHNLKSLCKDGWCIDTRISECIICSGKYYEERKRLEAKIGTEIVSESGVISTICGVVYPF